MWAEAAGRGWNTFESSDCTFWNSFPSSHKNPKYPAHLLEQKHHATWAFPGNPVLVTVYRHVAIVRHPYLGKAQPTSIISLTEALINWGFPRGSAVSQSGGLLCWPIPNSLSGIYTHTAAPAFPSYMSPIWGLDVKALGCIFACVCFFKKLFGLSK